jgi:hypothetical protein
MLSAQGPKRKKAKKASHGTDRNPKSYVEDRNMR